jgi:hypothetical protein
MSKKHCLIMCRLRKNQPTQHALDAANRAAFKGSGSGDGVLSSPRQ